MNRKIVTRTAAEHHAIWLANRERNAAQAALPGTVTIYAGDISFRHAGEYTTCPATECAAARA